MKSCLTKQNMTICLSSICSFVKRNLTKKKLLGVTALSTAGYLYFSAGRFRQKIDQMRADFFAHYEENDTELVKQLKEQIDLPMEKISNLLDTTNSLKVKEGFSSNRQELFQHEGQFDLKDFPHLKKYKEDCELKLASFKEMIKMVSETIANRNDVKNRDLEEHQHLIKSEQTLFDEIDKQKSDLLEKINSLESSKEQLNNLRREINEKIKQQTEIYSFLLKETLERIDSKYKLDLEAQRNQYQMDIRSFQIDFKKVEKEEVGKRELLRNLSDLTSVRKNYKENEIEFIKSKLATEHEPLITQYELLKTLSQEHKTVSHQYQQTKLEEYNLLNIFFSFEKVVDAYSEMKKAIVEEKMSDYSNRLYESVENRFKPYLKEKLLYLNYTEMVRFFDKAIKQNDLTLQENKKFISDYYKSKNAEILFLIKYLLYKQKETSVSEEEKLSKYSNLISKSFKELYNYSRVFDDEYTKTLIENAGLFTKKLPSKWEVLSEFDKMKKDLFFDLFYTDLSIPKTTNFFDEKIYITKFLICSFITLFYNIGLKYYDPRYNPIGENEHKFIKRVKALSFMDFHLKEENYAEAYHNLKYLTPVSPEKTQKVKDKLELMTKQEIVTDLLETHFKH